MKKMLCFFVGMLLLIGLLPLSVAADSVSVYDLAGVLTAEEISAITAAANEAEELSGCDFYFVTYDYNITETAYYGEDFLEDRGFSKHDNIVLLVITLDSGKYFYDLYTYGEAYTCISDGEVNYILDNYTVYDNLKTGRLFEGVTSFLKLTARAYRGEFSQWIYDNAVLFSDEELYKLSAVAATIRENTDCDFYIATHNSTWAIKKYLGEDFLEDYSLSSSDNIVLLVVTLDGGEYFYNIYTYGDARNRINNKEINYILDNDAVYDNLKSGRLCEGACAYLSLSEQAYSGRLGASYWIIAAVSFVIALIIGICVCVGVKVKYGTKHKSIDYPLDRFAKMELKERQDIFVGSFVTQRVIQSSSGGGRSGGSSHGGGGGHRGGR